MCIYIYIYIYTHGEHVCIGCVFGILTQTRTGTPPTDTRTDTDAAKEGGVDHQWGDQLHLAGNWVWDVSVATCMTRNVTASLLGLDSRFSDWTMDAKASR